MLNGYRLPIGAATVSKALIRDATVITLNADDEIFTPGDLVVDGEQLSYVGPPSTERRSERFDRIIDGSRLVAIPGLVNAHTHTHATLFAGCSEQLPLDIWRLLTGA